MSSTLPIFSPRPAISAGVVVAGALTLGYGWSWIDPAKEVDSQMASVRAGFTTVSDVIARTGEGRDLEDVIEERKRELEMMREAGLQFDTDPATAALAKPAAPKDPAADPDEPADPEEAGNGESEDDAPPAGRVIPMR